MLRFFYCSITQLYGVWCNILISQTERSNMKNMMSRLGDLQEYISRDDMITDPLDIIYAAQFVGNLSKQVQDNEIVSVRGAVWQSLKIRKSKYWLKLLI